MSRTISASGAIALALVLTCALEALASDPASHDITVPTTPGETVVVEWTGTALPGGSGLGTTGGVVDSSTAQPCPPVGPDDAHTITFSVPEGLYDGASVNADFHVEWDAGTPVGLFTDPDLVLAVYRDTSTLEGYSDGGSPNETVGLNNPVAGEYTAIVCPFLASQPTPYRAKLTVTVLEENACVSKPGKVLANAPSTGAAGLWNPESSGLPNFDVFQHETGERVQAIPTDLRSRHQSAIYDRTLGAPSFLWARTDAPIAAVGALSDRELLIAHARAHLRSEAKLLRLDAALIDQAEVIDAGFNGDGPAVVRFRQNVNGIEVFQRSLNVLLDRSYRPIAVSGYFASDFDRAALSGFTRSGAEAIATAWTSLGGELSADALTPTALIGAWQWYSRPLVSGTHWFEREPRAKRVYYPRHGALEPAYYVELFAKARVNGNLSAYGLVVSATDAAVLHRRNLKADAFTYRTFAETKGPLYQPYDSPLGNGYAPFRGSDPTEVLPREGGSTSLVTLDHAGIVTGDPWLEEGATQTTGNHVDACIDAIDQGVNTPAGGLAVPPPVNSCLEDVEPRAQTTGAGTFDYALEADEDPAHENAKNAAVVSLFYMNNWLHDWWYNHGFDEAAGNAQASNYGRGGEEGDPILAQGQDASGRNNANMATPSDGSSPVMQQYLFDGVPVGEVRVTAPADSGPLAWAPAAFSKPSYEGFTELVALADDGAGVSPTDGCGEAIPNPGLPVPPPGIVAPPQSSLAGKIALVDRGNCNFTVKAQFAIASGAIALIVVNNTGGAPITMGNADVAVGGATQPTDLVYNQIPAVMIRRDAGDAIKAQLAAGEVSAYLERGATIDVDGTLDNQIIAHEYFHYVHHRLTDSSNPQARAMSEGWGDIGAFMLTVRADDSRVPGNRAFEGAYGLAYYVSNNSYSGIRRAPYSVSFLHNAYTFRHISDGEMTPDGGAGTINSEVHNAGEIWANMVFECYVGVLTNPRNNFFEARSKMQDYIIGGFKMTPADATFTEARDAVLSVALATDFEDYRRCSRGFAQRGNGLNAVAPARSSSDLVGVVEDYTGFVCPANSNGGGKGGGDGGDVGGSGAGGFGLWLLAPLFGFAALRRRRLCEGAFF